MDRSDSQSMTAWQEIKVDLDRWLGQLFKWLTLMMLLFGVAIPFENWVHPSEQEGIVETKGCRIIVTHRTKPLFDYHQYICVYDRGDLKNPDSITAKSCAHVETENGICTFAEIYYSDSKQPSVDQNHANASGVGIPSNSRNCPIKDIHPSMLLEEVRGRLGGYVMDYRGVRQDESVYYVDAGVCHAFLDFNYADSRLDAIDYGEGDSKIESRR